MTAISKTIELDAKPVAYTLRMSTRTRGVRLAVHRDGRLVVSASPRLPSSFIEEFMAEKAAWILRQLAFFASKPLQAFPKLSAHEIAHYRAVALMLAKERLAYFNTFYGFSYRTVSIRAARTRWGSCTRQGRLNFNYKIALLPPQLADYIIVHELCHLGSFDHSRRFWGLVAKTIPDYVARRRELRQLDLQS